jgi:hypothetical protein
VNGTSPSGIGDRSASIWIAVAALIVLGANVAILVSSDDPFDLGGSVPGGAAPADEVDEADEEPGDETLRAQVERVAERVSELRGLRFDQVPEPVVMTPQDLQRRLDELLEDYSPEEADVDRRILASLGAVPPDADLREMLRDVLSEQVAGFYDPESGELVVVSAADGRRLGPMGEVTLAHELGHALVDQAIGLPHRPDVPDGLEDRALAESALVEGDATLLMIQYAQTALDEDDARELLEEGGDDLFAQSQALDGLPHYISRSLLFPYEDGVEFVAALYTERGWFGVDEAVRSPPSTSLAILDPGRYSQGLTDAHDVADPADPGDGWERLTQRSFGAADLLFLFEAPGDDPDARLDEPRRLAALWRGGTIALWHDGERDGIGIVLAGEEGLCDAMLTWYESAFPDDTREEPEARWSSEERAGVVACEGDDVRVGIGPDLETAQRLAD